MISKNAKTVCFDLSCSLYHRFGDPFISESEQARDYYRDKTCTFHGATAFTYAKRRYVDFTNYTNLLNCLLAADEIVTFNGRIYDLIALEKLTTEEDVLPLWKKPHHDLVNWKAWSLEDSIRIALPKLACSFDSTIAERKARITGKFGDNIATTLAGTYRDTKFTRYLFDQYTVSGANNRTFSN